LPSPAGAMAVMGACLYWPVSPWLFLAVVVVGVLMCSHWPFVHFGRVIAPRLKKVGVIILFSLLAGATAYLVKAGDSRLFGQALLAATAIYILAGNRVFFVKKINS
ncbi:MAG: phosphatidylserine synthase, partial [Planctomycetes bacterium]|nr:phosphatidylserine synthase [Planctomycetota bacterium]